MQVFYDFLAALEAMPRAKAAAEKALTLEPNLAEAHAALAFVKMTFDWDFTGAERSCRQAFELNPNFGPALYWHSGLLSILGRHEAAIAQGERLLELDPLSPIGHAQLAWRFRHARQDDEAIAWGRRLVAQWPDFGLGYVPLAEALGNKGLYSEAVGAARKAAALTGRSGMSLCVLGFASALAGDTVCAQQILAELDDPTRPWARRSIWRAGIQAALGDKTAALASLERAVEERDAVLPWLRTWSPADPLRDEPDFQEVLRKIGLTQ
jgi:serine/threonine-protein kinase